MDSFKYYFKMHVPHWAGGRPSYSPPAGRTLGTPPGETRQTVWEIFFYKNETYFAGEERDKTEHWKRQRRDQGDQI